MMKQASRPFLALLRSARIDILLYLSEHKKKHPNFGAQFQISSDVNVRQLPAIRNRGAHDRERAEGTRSPKNKAMSPCCTRCLTRTRPRDRRAQAGPCRCDDLHRPSSDRTRFIRQNLRGSRGAIDETSSVDCVSAVSTRKMSRSSPSAVSGFSTTTTIRYPSIGGRRRRDRSTGQRRSDPIRCSGHANPALRPDRRRRRRRHPHLAAVDDQVGGA